MDAPFVGWIRTHWQHWEPIVRGDDVLDVWDRLRNFVSTDIDGERLVLPRNERPIPLSRPL